jgi:transposase
MERYIGLDAHSQSCTFAVMGPSGRRLQERVLETHGTVLVDFVRSIPGDRYLCFEEGALSEWLYELLEPYTKETLVTQPRRRPGSKTDSQDAWELAEAYRLGGLKRVVFKAPDKFTAMRQAMRAYHTATRDMVRAKLRLKAVFQSRGLTPQGDIYESAARATWLKRLPAAHRTLAQLLSQRLEAAVEAQQEAEAWLLEESQKVDTVRLLSSVPGIGPIRAAQIVAIVVTPTRFRTKRQFWAYCGFAVVMHTTANYRRGADGGLERKAVTGTRGLNRNRNPVLKAAFTGAAMTVIQTMPTHPLHQDYQRLLQAKIDPAMARLTLARRIAAATWAIWKHKEQYDPARHQAPKSAV